MRSQSIDPKRAAARAVQALMGIVLISGGAAAFDWRAGLITAGGLTLVTSLFWRSTP